MLFDMLILCIYAFYLLQRAQLAFDARVGRIVPRTVVHGAPSHKLSARIVSVFVVVEKVGDREAARGNAVAGFGTGTAQLVFVAFHFFASTTEAEVVGEMEAAVAAGSPTGFGACPATRRCSRPCPIVLSTYSVCPASIICGQA